MCAVDEDGKRVSNQWQCFSSPRELPYPQRATSHAKAKVAGITQRKLAFHLISFIIFFIYNIFILHFYCTILIFIFRRATSHAQVKKAGITQEK